MEDLSELADLIRERNTIGKRISFVINRPSTIGHVGEFIASKVFDIRLEESASAKGIDGYFEGGSLDGCSVNIKWYGKQEALLDITPTSLPDYYLVMTGPIAQVESSKGSIRPWLIEHIYIFDSAELLAKLKVRGVKIGVATSIRKGDWQEAEIYPSQRSPSYVLSDEQRKVLAQFGSYK